jgi:hypothetical protein
MIDPAGTAGAKVAGAGKNGLAEIFMNREAKKRFGMSIASAISAWPL